MSSVPLFSLPPHKRALVVRQFSTLLNPGGHWIQYTYLPRSGYFRHLEEFSFLERRLVFMNVPPAQVVLLQRNGEANAAGAP